MNANNRNQERDAVLYAFHREYERPTVEQILIWVRRYPDYAEDIRAHAAVSHDWAARDFAPEVEVSQSLQNRGYSNALNALHNAQVKAEAAARAQSFHDIATARNTDVARIARDIDIGRSVVADLFNGWMLAPVRKRLLAAICKALAIPSDAFDAALVLALQNPRFGHAKASEAPTIKARSCDDIIRESNTPPDRQRYWLEED